MRFLQANGGSRIDLDPLCWYLNKFGTTMIITIPEWKKDGSTREVYGDVFCDVEHPEDVPRDVEEYRKSDRRRDFTEAV